MAVSSDPAVLSSCQSTPSAPGPSKYGGRTSSTYVIFGRKESFGAALDGAFAVSASCRNFTTEQSVPFPQSPGQSPWNCEAAGLDVSSGDRVAAIGMGPVKPQLGGLGGRLVAARPLFARCTNVTQFQQVSVSIPPGSASWDCEAAGLVVNEDDVVHVVGVGLAD